MSSNPNNAIGTNAAYDGRTSVNAFNDIMGLLSRGVLSGWECVPKSGMTVSIGGTSGMRDVAIAEDNNGNRTSINNISGVAVDVTISAAPASNSRIDLIVAYVDNPPTGTSTDTDNPGACGIITVEGTAAATPTAPDDSDIRTAITADGASGTTAYYVVLASLTIPSGTTDITTGEINPGDQAILAKAGVVTTDAIDYGTIDSWKDMKVASRTVALGYGISVNLRRIGKIVLVYGSVVAPSVPAQDTKIAETMPAGYRPTTSTSATILGNKSTGAASSLSWRVVDNGDLYLSCGVGWNNENNRIAVFGAWITEDAWPV